MSSTKQKCADLGSLLEASVRYASPLYWFVALCEGKMDVCSDSRMASSVSQYAEKCQFSHGVDDIRPVKRHPRYKTKLCRNWETTGYVSKWFFAGPECANAWDGFFWDVTLDA